jgi:hypothetical protein
MHEFLNQYFGRLSHNTLSGNSETCIGAAAKSGYRHRKCGVASPRFLLGFYVLIPGCIWSHYEIVSIFGFQIMVSFHLQHIELKRLIMVPGSTRNQHIMFRRGCKKRVQAPQMRRCQSPFFA